MHARMDRTITRPDDTIIQLSPGSAPRIQLGRSLLAIASVAALFIRLVNLHHGGLRVLPGELVFPVPPDVYAAAIFVTTFVIILRIAYAITRGSSATPFLTSRSSAFILSATSVGMPARLPLFTSACPACHVGLTGPAHCMMWRFR